MKLLFGLIFLLSNYLVVHPQPQCKIFLLEKDSNNFNVYSQSGELLLKFTPLNTDSEGLSILDLIYSEGTILKDNSNIVNIKVTELPKESILKDYILGIISIISGIIGVIIGWYLTGNRFNQTKFEENFFKLLDTQDKILQSILFRKEEFEVSNDFRTNLFNTISGKKVYTDYIGINFFTYIKDKLQNDYKNNGDVKYYSDKGEMTTEKQLEYAKEIYGDVYSKHSDYLGHYFRHLYHIIKYVDDNEKKIKKFAEPKTYTDLIQARMSSSELVLLFYNSLIFEKMKKFVNKYKLTQNLVIENLMDESHKDFISFEMKSNKQFL